MKKSKSIFILVITFFVLCIATNSYCDDKIINEFVDYPRSTNDSEAVYKLVDYGIIDITENFRPDDYMSRAEFIELFNKVFMLKPNNSKVNTYKDIPKNHWAYQSVNTLESNGYYLYSYEDRLYPDSLISELSAFILIIDGLGYGTEVNSTSEYAICNDYYMLNLAIKVDEYFYGDDRYATREIIYKMFGNALSITFNDFGDGNYETLMDMYEKNEKIDYTNYKPEKIIEFKNEVIENYIRDTYDLSGEIQWKDLYQIKNIKIDNLCNKQIDDFSDLVWFTNLEIFSVKMQDGAYSDSFEDCKPYLPNLSHLKKLECFEYEIPSISFELERFSGMHSLKVLNLKYGFVNGSLSILSNMKNLEELRMSGHFIGDTDILGKLQHLKVIDFPYFSYISGDLSNITDNLQLEEFCISQPCNINGDIEGFSKMNNLKRFELLNIGNDIYGDIKAFENLKNLEDLVIRYSGVSGNISSIKQLSKLKDLCVSETLVEGSINDLYFNDLEYVDFSKSKITGDIEKLKGSKNIFCLYVNSSDVEGDISIFQDYSNLSHIALSGSKVYGSIKSKDSNEVLGPAVEKIKYNKSKTFDPYLVIEFEDSEFERAVRDKTSKSDGKLYWNDIINIEEINLTDYDISSINDVIWLKNLREFVITKEDKFNINSNIAVFENLKNLQVIDMKSCGVGGNIASLKNLKKLKEVSFEDSYVRGVTSDIKTLINIEKLNVFNSDVKIVKDSLNNFKQLKVIMGSSNSEIQLSDLSNLSKLEKIYLYSTLNDIYGELNDLKKLSNLDYLVLDSNNISGDLSDIRNLTKIEKLDLDSDRLTGDLSSLVSLNRLKELTIESYLVTADFVDIAKLDNLEKLYLRLDKTNGQLKCLSKLKKLKYINISSESVEGTEDDLPEVETVIIES